MFSYSFVHLFVYGHVFFIYLIMLSVSPHTKRQMVRWCVNIELDKTWKEAAVVVYEVGVLSRHFPKGTYENYEVSVKVTGLQAVVLTRDFENRSGDAHFYRDMWSLAYLCWWLLWNK